eukprot:1146310-Pelagomonas_calceolata.AAC.5
MESSDCRFCQQDEAAQFATRARYFAVAAHGWGTTCERGKNLRQMKGSPCRKYAVQHEVQKWCKQGRAVFFF